MKSATRVVSRGLVRRWVCGSALGAAVLLCSLPGLAAPEKPPKEAQVCARSYKGGLKKQAAGQLRAARELFVTCSHSVCGKPISRACTSRVASLDSNDIPSIVPHVTDPGGAQRTDVKVRMDGELLTSRLDGQGILVDPGAHEFTFSTENGMLAKEKVVVVEGQRNRQVDVTLHQADPKELEAEKASPEAPVTAVAPPTPAGEAKREGEHEAEGEHGEATVPMPKDPQACMNVFRTAEANEQAGHLRAARSLLVMCSRSVCGRSLLQQCADKFTELDSVDLPSIRPSVTDDAGASRSDVQVRMDGELLAARLDGQPLAVDPGMHEFTFSTEGGLSASQKILIVEGQLARPVAVVLRGSEKTAPDKEPTPEKAKPEETTPSPPKEIAEDPTGHSKRSAAPYLIGGAVLAAVEGGALALYLGKGDTSHLAVDTSIGVSIGVGAVTLGIATWLLLTSHPKDEPVAPQSSYVFDVQPTPSGAYASFKGRF